MCGTGSNSWLDALASSLEGLTSLGDLRGASTVALRGLREAAQGPAGDVRRVLAGTVVDEPLAKVVIDLDDAVASLMSATDQDGHGLTGRVRAAATRVADLLSSRPFGGAVAEAARHTEHQRQWLGARRAAVQPLVEAWPAFRTACDKPSWETAKRNLRTLQDELREERSARLESGTRETVQALLSDVGLDVESVTVSQRAASIDIADAAGGTVTLSMLSAGQRNAVLLAPLLAQVGEGPFGFLVLDDPVHAFDAVRVDRLAGTLRDIAATRRVVVLTHDERLREHLLIQPVPSELWEVEREPSSGCVVVVRSLKAWAGLLNDASMALDVASAHPGVTRDDVIRGLCRMAVDDALRAAVHRHAVAAGQDVVAALTSLDGRHTTSDRLMHVADVGSGTELAIRVNEARTLLAPYLAHWNRASHGNDAVSAADATEVRAARDACKGLTR